MPTEGMFATLFKEYSSSNPPTTTHTHTHSHTHTHTHTQQDGKQDMLLYIQGDWARQYSQTREWPIYGVSCMCYTHPSIILYYIKVTPTPWELVYNSPLTRFINNAQYLYSTLIRFTQCLCIHCTYICPSHTLLYIPCPYDASLESSI